MRLFKILEDVKIAAKSLYWQNSFSLNKQTRKASASSFESAETTNGNLDGFSIQFLNVFLYAVIEEAKIKGDKLGSQTVAQCLQA